MRLPSPKAHWDGSVILSPAEWTLKAGEVGQLFGLAIGDPPQRDAARNLYFSATSAYGLHIVRRRNDGSFERLRQGAPGAMWAPGQFGIALQGGPGAIYVVDGATGAVNLLTNVALDGIPNPGPGLGAIAYDGRNKQLFATDLYTGMIHRIGLDGSDLGRLDHGVTVRAQAQLSAVPFDARTRMAITNPAFQVDDSNTWGLAPPARRVWAVTVHDGRVYYSVAEGLQIWSVGLKLDGDFASDSRLEAIVPDYPGPYPVTDIAFAPDGAMIVAQRSAFGTGNFNYSAFTSGGEPRVIRFVLKRPDEPPSPGLWKLPEPSHEYSVGFAGAMRNSNGGVALGYGYDQNNRLNLGACGTTLFATGDRLRVNSSMQDRLVAGGKAAVHGVQLAPISALRDRNFPEPWQSQFVDYNSQFDDPDTVGRMGQVRVLSEPCAPPAAAVAVSRPPIGGVSWPPGPPETWTVIDEPVCNGVGCLPDCGGFPCQPCDFANAVGGHCPPPGTPIDLAIKKKGVTSLHPAVNAYMFNLAVTSVSGVYNGAGIITVTDTVPPGMTFNTATGTNWTCGALPAAAGQTITCTYTGPGPTAPNQSLGNIAISATASGSAPFPPFRNCARVGVPLAGGLVDTDPRNNVDCVTVKKPHDVAIKKTGELTEGPAASGATFNLAVTNVYGPFSGANIIQVSDVVPPGMTFTAATGPNWTCGTLPATAGQTITCTYTGPGPSAAGQSLGNIKVTATTTGDGPWENCALVGITPGSGVTDFDPANNRDCVTLKKRPKPNDVTIEKVRDTSDGNADGICGVNLPCKFLIRVKNNSPWPFSGPLVFSDASTPPMMIVSTDLPCNPSPTAMPFSCTGNVSLPAGPAVQVYHVTGMIPAGSIPPAYDNKAARNCATIADPPPVPGSWPLLVSSQQGCVTYRACGYACHMSDQTLASLSIQKQANSTTCTPGGLCSYTFNFTNTTTSVYNKPIVFTDVMPAGSSMYVPTPPPPAPWSCAPFMGSPDQTQCLIRYPNIPPGGTVSLTISFQLSPTYNQSTLTNCAEFYNGSAPSAMRRASPQNYGMKSAEELRAYLAMRGINEPPSLPPAAPSAKLKTASAALPVLGADDRSCTTVNIVQPPPPAGTGDITVKKLVVNQTPGTIPTTSAYNIAVTCGTSTTNMALLHNGASTISNIPLNTSCTVTETPPAPPATCGPVLSQWTTTIAPPAPVTITGTGTVVTVTNTLTCVTHPPGTGRLLIKKVVDAPLPTSMTFPVNVSCTDGTTRSVGVTSTMDAEISPLPTTASCTVTEGSASIPPNVCAAGKHGVWATTYAPSQTVTAGTNATVTITNKLNCVDTISSNKATLPPIVPPGIPPKVASDPRTCPPGTVRRNGRCVPPPAASACVAPFVANADGTCACPAGTIRRGRRCVEPPPRQVCRAPMVQRADGSCACPAGTVQRGGRCLPVVACNPPARPDGRGGCVCPRGLEMRRGVCVDLPRIRDAIVPGMIEIIPGIIGRPRNGGGNDVPRPAGRP